MDNIGHASVGSIGNDGNEGILGALIRIGVEMSGVVLGVLGVEEVYCRRTLVPGVRESGVSGVSRYMIVGAGVEGRGESWRRGGVGHASVGDSVSGTLAGVKG